MDRPGPAGSTGSAGDPAGVRGRGGAGGRRRPDQPPAPPVAVVLDRSSVGMADDYETHVRRVELDPDTLVGDVLLEIIRALPSVAGSVSWTLWARNHPVLRHDTSGAVTGIDRAAGERVRCAFVSAPYRAETQIAHIGGLAAHQRLRTSYLTPAPTGEYVFEAVYHTDGALIGLAAYQEWLSGQLPR